jgi:hypothetical protein
VVVYRQDAKRAGLLRRVHVSDLVDGEVADRQSAGREGQEFGGRGGGTFGHNNARM